MIWLHELFCWKSLRGIPLRYCEYQKEQTKSQFCQRCKADDTLGNFLSNAAWALSHWEWVTNLNMDTWNRSWALCLTWLPIDTNINRSFPATFSQKVAPCIISLREHSRQDADWIRVIGQGVIDTSGRKVKETTDYTINTLNEGGKVGWNYPPLIVIQNFRVSNWEP